MMMKFNFICTITACAAFLLFGAGCASPRGEAGAGAGQVAAMPGDDADFPAYMEVATGQVYQRAERPVPEGGYINGVMVDGAGFQPMTHVRGDYPCLCGIKKLTGQYTRGRRDLSTGEFKPGDPDAARPPYIAGRVDQHGVFTPDQRAVTF
jgi:hypothetical protein